MRIFILNAILVSTWATIFSSLEVNFAERDLPWARFFDDLTALFLKSSFSSFFFPFIILYAARVR